MARRARRQSTNASREDLPDGAPPAGDLTPGILISFKPGAMKAGLQQLTSTAGLKTVAHAAEFDDGAVDFAQAAQAGMIVFDALGVAVMDADPDQETALATLVAAGDGIVQKLEHAGMTVAETFDLGGVIVGAVPERSVGALHKVPGIAAVEEEPAFRTGS